MFHIVLVSPEIPPNTGNVIRLSANTGCTLHLIKPLGFSLDDSHLRRAGLDYREYATLKTYESWDDFIEKEHPDPRDLDTAFLPRHAVSARGEIHCRLLACFRT